MLQKESYALESADNPRRNHEEITCARRALATAATAQAQQYPQRPVQLIVPWGAGGGTDATARIIGTLLEKELKQPFNVVNRTGGSGVVGHDAIARRRPMLHDRHDHGRDHHDASRRSYAAQAHRLHADRVSERRPWASTCVQTRRTNR